MKIGYLVPVPLYWDVQEATSRGELLKKWAFPNTEVNFVIVTEGPMTIESKYEEYLSFSATTKEIVRFEKEGYDAAILGCAVDPGLDAMREITTKMLVVGLGEASVLTAAMLGHKFSIISLYESAIAIHEEVVYKAGVLDKLASVRAVNIAVLDIIVNRKYILEKIIRVSQKAIEDDGADCLVLGCGMMGFLNVADEISKFLKIPVINPPKVALKMAESLVSIGLMHSKKAFALPPKLSLGKVKNIDQLFVYGHCKESGAATD